MSTPKNQNQKQEVKCPNFGLTECKLIGCPFHDKPQQPSQVSEADKVAFSLTEGTQTKYGPSQEWEKEFEEKFPEVVSCACPDKRMDICVAHEQICRDGYTEIKSFLRNKIQAAESRGELRILEKGVSMQFGEETQIISTQMIEKGKEKARQEGYEKGQQYGQKIQTEFEEEYRKALMAEARQAERAKVLEEVEGVLGGIERQRCPSCVSNIVECTCDGYNEALASAIEKIRKLK